MAPMMPPRGNQPDCTTFSIVGVWEGVGDLLLPFGGMRTAQLVSSPLAAEAAFPVDAEQASGGAGGVSM
jgi:hypothetical protein